MKAIAKCVNINAKNISSLSRPETGIGNVFYIAFRIAVLQPPVS